MTLLCHAGGTWPAAPHHERWARSMKSFKAAIFVGVLSAAFTWIAVYFLIHEPTVGHAGDGLRYSWVWPQDDDELTALLWAAGAYVLTFTPTLLFLRGRTRKDVFAQRQSNG